MDKKYTERVELHCHSVYSAEDGVSKVEDIIKFAMDNRMPAVAITDHASVAGFGEADYFSKQGTGIKMIYGMEAFAVNDLDPAVVGDEKYIKDSPSFHVIFLIKNEVGKQNLFELMTIAEEKYKGFKPRIPWSEIMKHREGLLVGSACEVGELYLAVMEEEPDEVLERIASKYDYIEIQPAENKIYFADDDEISHDEGLEYVRQFDKCIIEVAERLGKTIVATSDAHFVTKDEAIFRSVLQRHVGYEDDNQVDIYFRTTDEMLDSFSYLGKEKAWEIVVENTNKIADSITEIEIIGNSRENYPKLDGAHLRLREICYSRLDELFGKDIPTEYINQLDWELHSFMESGADSLLLLTKELVVESGLSSYEIGYRGCLGGLLTAYLCGITCVDPLDSKYVLYPEFVIGLEGDKIPEISLNFPKKVQNKLWDTCGDLEDIGSAFHAGVIETMSDSEAATAIFEYEGYHGMIFDNDKRCLIEEHLRSVTKKHGMNPGAMLLVPEWYEITEFSPLTKISNGNMATEISYHSLDNLWWLYILTNPHINMLSALINKTGIKVEKISLEDKEVEAVINGTSKVSMLGVPEVDSEFVRMLLKDMGANSFTDLVQAISLSHGTNVWLDNMEILLKSGDITKESILATREDIFECLLAIGFTREDAFMIAEFVRKGKARKNSGKWEAYKESMMQAGAPDWFVESCEKIQYMFPRAHAYIYALHTWWTIWFKIHFPNEFYEAYMDVRASDRLKQIVGNGKEAFLSYKEGYLDALEDGFCVPDRISEEEFYVIEEMLMENNNF